MFRLNIPDESWDGASRFKHVGDVVRLEPWVPFVCDGPEATFKTPRLCLCPTIEQCFIGISQWSARIVKQVDEFSGPSYEDEWWWALTPVGSPMFVTPPVGIVQDVDDTDEVWIMEPWDFMVIGRVQMYWRAEKKTDPLEWKFVEGGFTSAV